MIVDFFALASRLLGRRTPSFNDQMAEIVTILNSITATSYPDHAWVAKNMVPHLRKLKHVKFIMVGRREAGGLAYGNVSELKKTEFEPLFKALLEAGFSRVPVSNGMSVASDVVFTHGRIRPRIDNVDLEILRARKDDIRASLNVNGVVCRLGKDAYTRGYTL